MLDNDHNFVHPNNFEKILHVFMKLNIHFYLAFELPKSEIWWKSHGCLKFPQLYSVRTIRETSDGPGNNDQNVPSKTRDGPTSFCFERMVQLKTLEDPIYSQKSCRMTCSTFSTSWGSLEFFWTPNWMSFLSVRLYFHIKLLIGVSSQNYDFRNYASNLDFGLINT